MFAYLAGITKNLGFVTGVLILPQRQAALVAKQATDVDLLSRERLRLGVGSGWNHVEYQGLGKDFTNRGKRMDEQIDFMRRLWTEPLVTYHGDYEHLDRGNLNIRPKRSIPVWIGGFGEAAFRRGALLGDGFIFGLPYKRSVEHLARLRELLAEAGRDEATFGLELIGAGDGDARAMADIANRWREAGGTHHSVLTMGRGFTSVDQHLEHLAAVKDAIG
jgi:probable F420-dependent oxidoreductase